jgi:uncharacterized repeat protein (TIGR03943 family)
LTIGGSVRGALRRRRAEESAARLLVPAEPAAPAGRHAVQDEPGSADTFAMARQSGVLRPDPELVGAAVGAAVAAPADSPEKHINEDAHGHSHGRSRAPWLILAPVLVLLVTAPPALGADAVARNGGSQALKGLEDVASTSAVGSNEGAGGGGSDGYAFNDGSGKAVGTKNFAKQRPTMQFPDLPAGTDPAIGLKEFVMRALYDADDSVSANNVTVTGFIAPAGDGYTSGYSIARMVVSCCAADASPMRIHVDGTPPYPENTWVTAVVQAQAGTASQDNDYVPAVDVSKISQTSEPSDPYEH